MLGLALGPAVALGLARFAYSLLLPAMQADLSWSFAQAGAMNTANALGYLTGALVAAPVIARVGERRAFMFGMVASGVALAAAAISGTLGVLLVLRLATGITGAITFVAGASLTAQLATGGERDRGGLALTVYLAGAGLGVVVSGVLVPAILGIAGDAGWHEGWLALGALALIAAAIAAPAANRSQEPPRTPQVGDPTRWQAGPVLPAMGAYALFGAGYIAYVTFVVSYIRGEGATSFEVAAFWVVLGASAVGAAFAWGSALERIRDGRGIAWSTGTVAVGALIPLLSGSTVATFGSALVFGGSFLSVPAAATAFARVSHRPEQWTIAIAALTTAFALGQCIGPILAGVLSDGPSGVRAGLVLSAAILAAGAALALAQRNVDQQAGPR